MIYEEALKKSKEIRVKEMKKYIQISFGYSGTYAFPYKEGLTLLSCLDKGMKIDSPYSTPPKITHISSDDITVKILDDQEIQDMHIAQLLNVPIKDLEHARNPT